MTLTDTELKHLMKAIGLRRPRGGSQRKPIAHGTYRGVSQHYYQKTPVCPPCRAAERAYQSERRNGGAK